MFKSYFCHRTVSPECFSALQMYPGGHLFRPGSALSHALVWRGFCFCKQCCEDAQGFWNHVAKVFELQSLLLNYFFKELCEFSLPAVRPSCPCHSAPLPASAVLCHGLLSGQAQGAALLPVPFKRLWWSQGSYFWRAAVHLHPKPGPGLFPGPSDPYFM